MNARAIFSLIILFFSMHAYAQADEYEVSGVNNPEYFNGIYSRGGTHSSRPYYRMDTSQSWSGAAYLYYGPEGWSIGNVLGGFSDIYNPSSAWTPPATGWLGGGGGEIRVVRPEPRISYSNKEWLESFENDGSFEQTAQITIDNSAGQTFTGTTGDDFIALGYAIIGNLPEGLTAKLIKEHDLGLELFFEGQATASSHADSVEVSLSFQDGAFENGTADGTRDSMTSDLLLRFRDELFVGPAGDYSTISAAVAGANPDDIIRVAAGTYTEQEITISKNLSIIGAGAGETIVQAAAAPNSATGRVFAVGTGLTDMLLQDLTIRHGVVMGTIASGGGVEARSPITLRNCEVVDNTVEAGGGTGGGISANSGLIIENCLIARNHYISIEDRQSAGGGIYSSSRQTTIVNTTITDNHLSSTVANRVQTLRGGGISIRQVFNDEQVSILNSTIVNNTNEGQGGGISLDNITSTDGIELVNNIVIDNTSDASSNDADIFTTSVFIPVYIRHSIIGAVPDANLVHINIINSENIDPQLDTLGNYGGNAIGFQLLSGSPAIGAGVVMDGIPDLDQRGFSRSGNPDIGAFQYDGTLPVYVTYFANGGSGSVPELGHSLSSGKSFTVSGAGSLVFTNQAFDGWNTAQDGSGVRYGPGDSVTTGSTDINLYAQWVPDVVHYTLTYVAGTGGSIDGDVAQTVIEGDSGTAVTAVADTGYSFVDWSDGVTSATRQDTDVFSDLSVTANFTLNEYTVTFLVNGVPFDQQTVQHGSGAVDPGVPTVTGYDFIDWDVDFNDVTSDLTVNAILLIKTYPVNFYDHENNLIVTVYVEHGSSAPAPTAPARDGYTFTGWSVDLDSVTSPLDAIAQYDINTYTVRFLDWDGSVLSTQTVNWNTAATAPVDPTRDGHTFTSWDVGFATITSDLDVTAQYDINTFTVRFLDWDESVITTETVNWNEGATAPADPERDGYTFSGWDVGFTTITSDLDVTAQYDINTFTVRFLDWDDSVLATETVNWNEGATAPADPTRDGYTFSGWDVGFTTITSDLDVTAQYDINTYTVRFLDWDDSVLATETVNWNEGATAPADPEREGYTFTGWDVGFAAVTSDLDVTAQYSINTYTVTVEVIGPGLAVPSPISVVYGEQVEFAVQPEPRARLVSAVGCDGAVDENNIYRTGNIIDDCEIILEFEAIPRPTKRGRSLILIIEAVRQAENEL